MSGFSTYVPLPEVGAAVIGRASTATLYVSPNGSNADGKTWSSAYNTIQAALDAASTDADDCTLILIGPHATYYDINTTGDPTWTGNYILKGSHRLWAPVRNEHNNATSVFKFTGKISLVDLAIFSTDNGIGGSVGGVISTQSGFRIRHCGFNSESVTHACTGIHIDGSGGFIRGGIIEEVKILGTAAYTTGLYLDTAKINNFTDMIIHGCLKGVQIINAASDDNEFCGIDIGNCSATVAVEGTDGIAFDIDAGNEQHFNNILLHNNTINFATVTEDHHYQNIIGEFPIYLLPLNDVDTGVSVSATEDGWGGDTVLIAADALDKPFKVVGYVLEPSADENMRMRFSANSGTTHFAETMFASKKNKASAAGTTTDFVFNANTRISASAYAGSGGRTIRVWLEIQEI